MSRKDAVGASVRILVEKKSMAGDTNATVRVNWLSVVYAFRLNNDDSLNSVSGSPSDQPEWKRSMVTVESCQ